MKRLFLLGWVVAVAAAAAAGGEEAFPGEREVLPVWSPVLGGAQEEGMVAFMGFDFGKEVEWAPMDCLVCDAWPGRHLARKFALETPWHGFESVETWGDVETRLPIALVFERFVPNGEKDSSKADAQRWFEEVLADFPVECGVDLGGGMWRSGTGTACGGDNGLEVRVYTGGAIRTLWNGESESGTVWGRRYEVRVRVAAKEGEGF